MAILGWMAESGVALSHSSVLAVLVVVVTVCRHCGQDSPPHLLCKVLSTCQPLHKSANFTRCSAALTITILVHPTVYNQNITAVEGQQEITVYCLLTGFDMNPPDMYHEWYFKNEVSRFANSWFTGHS